MSEVAATERPITVSGLIEVTEKFIRNCRHSHEVDARWLVDFMAEPLRIMRQVRHGGLDPDLRAKVNAFRARELEDEIRQKQGEVAALERDLKMVKAA